MIKMGEYNVMTVIKEKSPGLFLDDGADGILLPKRFVPAGTQIGDDLRVFLYHDGEDRPIATTQKPYGVVGDIVKLKAVSSNNQGAFLDWGLMKDLFVPKSKIKNFMVQGGEYLVKIYLDERTGRIAASEKLEAFLSNDELTVKVLDEVDLLVYRQTEIGYEVIINHVHKGILHNNEIYLTSVRKALTGDVDYMKLSKDSIKAGGFETNGIDLNPSKAELELRKKVALEDKYNLFEKAKPKVDLVLFPPVRGPITEKYNAKEKHFAVDIALAKNTPIKAVANGTVIFADWTPTNGNVIILRHNNEFLSVYKHCESLTVSQGDVVKTSEVIAIAGSTGEQSTGIHLHFELWKDGYSIDPTQFIDFE